MDLLLTGATGFVGSHLALQWLTVDPAARVGCLVRAVDDEAGRVRLRDALLDAVGREIAAEDLLSRVDAFSGDLDDPAWIAKAAAWMRNPTEIIHCAANLSFRETDRAAVWRSNLDGTNSLLRGIGELPLVTGFNYISTAYVAGSRQGEILEDEIICPLTFNNPYEESKYCAEKMVRESCATSNTPWRILRPSIVIAHSVTHQMSSHSGFYQVVDTLLQLGSRVGQTGPISLPVTPGTALDLIPVDVVAREIVGLIVEGTTTAGRTFHIVSAQPLLLADVLRELSPMIGASIDVDGSDASLSPAARLVMRRLRYYTPYFGFARRFDRRNSQAALGRRSYRLGLEELKAFVRSYLAQQKLPTALKAAA